MTSVLIPQLSLDEIHTYSDLIERSRLILKSLLKASNQDTATINKIISAHPRLGPSKQALSTHSSSEQLSLQSSDPTELAKLVKLNELYELWYPGLRFVVFVNGRSRDEIMEIMLKRIVRNDIELEKKESFDAMCDIAIDRARKLGAKL